MESFNNILQFQEVENPVSEEDGVKRMDDQVIAKANEKFRQTQRDLFAKKKQDYSSFQFWHQFQNQYKKNIGNC